MTFIVLLDLGGWKALDVTVNYEGKSLGKMCMPSYLFTEFHELFPIKNCSRFIPGFQKLNSSDAVGFLYEVGTECGNKRMNPRISLVSTASC